MKKLLFLFIFLTQLCFSQVDLRKEDWQESNYLYKTTQIMSCAASNTISTGYPVWTNYYAGYMFKINNISSCSITVNCFEARFDGSSGYRIYTKTGTFIGFEGTPGAWVLVGNVINGVNSISTITCSPIPIVVNVVIPPGNSQSFYLTRTDNIVANRHLYITGTGTPGTTVYSSDLNVQITEAEYLDTYFILQVGTRRPSFNMYYDLNCILPIQQEENKNTSNLISTYDFIPEISVITDLYGTKYNEVPNDFKGVLIIKYKDGSYKKICKTE